MVATSGAEPLASPVTRPGRLARDQSNWMEPASMQATGVADVSAGSRPMHRHRPTSSSSTPSSTDTEDAAPQSTPPVHTSVTAGARGKTSCGAHVCLCTCRQYARVPSLTCNILPQLPFEQQAYARCVLQKPCVIRVSCQCAAMPIPGTPVGGERATGSIGTEPQRSTSVEDTDEDFRDPEATLLDPIVLPKRRWGHYAKWAMRHTDRLVPLLDKPTRAATTIPGPTKAKGVVDAKIGPRGRAVAKMAAKAGLRCLVCHAVTHTCDHTEWRSTAKHQLSLYTATLARTA